MSFYLETHFSHVFSLQFGEVVFWWAQPKSFPFSPQPNQILQKTIFYPLFPHHFSISPKIFPAKWGQIKQILDGYVNRAPCYL